MPGASRSDIKKKVNRGLAWVGLASSMVGLLDILAHVIILALWVSNEQFGVAMLAIALFPVLDLAAELGISAAVIQRDDHTEDKIATVFWLNLGISVALFLVLWLAIGPALASVQDAPVIASLLAVYGTKLVWANVYTIPNALMQRELRFKELSVIRIIANFAEFAAKVGFAAAGWGIWCFIVAPLCRVLVTGIGVQLRHPWLPRLVFRPREALDWAVYGVKTSASRILFFLYTNVDYHIVGYYFGKEANGLYSIAYLVVLEPCKVIGEIVTQIAFPTFARLKRQKDKLVEQFIAFTRMNMVVMLLFLGVVFVSAQELLVSFWGPTRLPAAPTMQILCAVGVLRAMSFVPPPLLDGVGKPSHTLLYMIVASIVVPISFVVGAEVLGPRYQEVSVAIAWAVSYPVAFAVLAVLALRQIGMTAGGYLRRLIGIPICAALATGASALVHWPLAGRAPDAVTLVVTGGVMIGLFLLLLAYFQGISPRSVARAIKGDPPSVHEAV